MHYGIYLKEHTQPGIKRVKVNEMSTRWQIIDKALSFQQGGMSKLELEFLFEFCFLQNYCLGRTSDINIIELGSMVGMSSYVMAATGCYVHCVDAWDDTFKHLDNDVEQKKVYERDWFEQPLSMYSTFCNNCEQFIVEHKIKAYKGNTSQHRQSFQDGFADILLVDADHSYQGVKDDIDNYLPKVKNGRYIIFHDYGKDGYWTGVTTAVDEAVKLCRIKPYNTFERIGIFTKEQ